jgi:hypothetical protein
MQFEMQVASSGSQMSAVFPLKTKSRFQLWSDDTGIHTRRLLRDALNRRCSKTSADITVWPFALRRPDASVVTRLQLRLRLTAVVNSGRPQIVTEDAIIAAVEREKQRSSVTSNGISTVTTDCPLRSFWRSVKAVARVSMPASCSVVYVFVRIRTRYPRCDHSVSCVIWQWHVPRKLDVSGYNLRCMILPTDFLTGNHTVESFCPNFFSPYIYVSASGKITSFFMLGGLMVGRKLVYRVITLYFIC